MNISNTKGTIINDPDVIVHRMPISVNERWQSDKVHIVLGRVQVDNGISLNIASDTTVKFWRNSYIFLEDSASVDIGSSTVFTRAEDDSVDGDSNKDGYLSVPQNGKEYIRGNGIANVGPEVTIKYLVRTYSGALETNQTWYGGQIYHITGNLIVPNNITLTIMPGAILKFDANCSLVVSSGGKLIAEGTAAQPIIFTSIKDDAYGGDTNEDEDWSTPRPGDWNEIRNNGGIISFNHCRISYGGWGQFANQGDGMLRNSSGTMTVQNSVLQGALLRLVSAGSENVEIVNTILDDGRWGVEGNAALTNCIITNCTTSLSGSSGTLTNSVVYNSGSVFGYSVTYSNFWLSGSMPSGNGNISANPLFRDAINGDYRLRAGSPLIDAGDGEKAPQTDFYGSGRVNDNYMMIKNGTANSQGVYADIGPFEFNDNADASYDLEPIDIQAPASVTTGEKITIQWSIRNNGSVTVDGSWTDLIQLISSTGQVVNVKEIPRSSVITADGIQTFFAEIIVPNISEGIWTFAVQVNVHRNFFEGIHVDNNDFVSKNKTVVAVPLLTEQNWTLALESGHSRLYRVDIPAGQAFYLSAVSANPVSIHLSENVAPNANAYDYTAASDNNGLYVLHVPAATSVRTMYLSIAAKTKATSITLSTQNESLALASATVTNVSNKGASTIGFIGGGFDSSMTVSLKSGDTTITGANLVLTSGSNATANFDLTGKSAGIYDLVITKNGRSVTLENAITVKANGVGTRLEAYFDIVDAVRVGRIYQGWIIYENTGDCDMLVPVFTLASNSGAPIGLSADSLASGGEVAIAGIGSPGSAGILRPGERGRVAFYFEATNNTNINFGSWWEDDNNGTIFENDYWTNWADCHCDISETLTLLGLRGYSTSDFYEIDSFLTAKKAGGDTTGLSGYLRNSQTGEAFSGCTLMAEWTVDDETRFDFATTDENGFYVFNYLPANAAVSLSLTEGAYDLSVSSVAMKDGKDITGFNMTAMSLGSISGYVNHAGGGGVEGVIVFATNSSGESVAAVTDSRGYFLFNSLKRDTWTVEIQNSGFSQSNQSETVTVDSSLVPSVRFTLSAIGSISSSLSGKIFVSTDVPATEGTVVIYSIGEYDAPDFQFVMLSAEIDSDGSFQFESLVSGEYLVEIHTGAGTAFMKVFVGESSNSLNITLPAQTDFSGKINFTSPIPQGEIIFVMIISEDGTVPMFVEVDENGNFTTGLIPRGTYHIIVFSAESIFTEQDVVLNSAVQSIQINSSHVFAAQSPILEAMASSVAFSATSTSGGRNIFSNISSYIRSQVLNYESVMKDDQSLRNRWGRLPQTIVPTKCGCISQEAANNYNALYVNTLSLFVYVYNPELGKLGQLFKDVVEANNLYAIYFAAWMAWLATAESDDPWLHYDSIQEASDMLDAREALAEAKRKFDAQYAIVNHFQGEISGKIQDLESRKKKCECNPCKCDKKTPPPPPQPSKLPEDDGDPDDPKSVDPNEIVGPMGVDYAAIDMGTEEEPYLVITSDNWISDDRDQVYTIYFENKPSATAAAQEVFVTMQMPEQWDWDMFVLQEICVGTQIFDEMVGYESGAWLLRQTSTGEQIQLSVTFDTLTGTADWYLRSYVASTFDHFPVSAYDGFLPPNDDTHCGEGYVKFGIRLPDGIETGTVIESSASIVFDLNDPIITNIWKNTIDSDAPESRVQPLPNVTEVSRFLVSWTGSDIGSGVGYYDVYVSVDGGDYTIWQKRTTETSAYFEGENGKTYAFVSIATDNVGLAEAFPDVADAVTTLDVSPYADRVTRTITMTAGSEANHWTVRRNVDVLEIVNAENDIEFSESMTDFNHLVINTSGATDDRLTLDFSHGGAFFLAYGIEFEGHIDHNESLFVIGSDGDDVLQINIDATELNYGGLPIYLNSVEQVNIDGREGSDQVWMIGSGGDDTFTFADGIAKLTTPNAVFTTVNMTEIFVDAFNGNDNATIIGTETDGVYSMSDNSFVMQAGGYRVDLRGFNRINAFADGMRDKTYVYGQNDSLIFMNDQFVERRGEGQSYRIWRSEQVIAINMDDANNAIMHSGSRNFDSYTIAENYGAAGNANGTYRHEWFDFTVVNLSSPNASVSMPGKTDDASWTSLDDRNIWQQNDTTVAIFGNADISFRGLAFAMAQSLLQEEERLPFRLCRHRPKSLHHQLGRMFRHKRRRHNRSCPTWI